MKKLTISTTTIEFPEDVRSTVSSTSLPHSVRGGNSESDKASSKTRRCDEILEANKCKESVNVTTKQRDQLPKALITKQRLGPSPSSARSKWSKSSIPLLPKEPKMNPSFTNDDRVANREILKAEEYLKQLEQYRQSLESLQLPVDSSLSGSGEFLLNNVLDLLFPYAWNRWVLYSSNRWSKGNRWQQPFPRRFVY